TEPAYFDFRSGYLYGFGAHMFNRRGDIIGTFPYSSSNAWKREREVEASLEFYEPDDGETMRMNVGVKIFGGWGSRGYAQKSMALFARAEYGYGKIRHGFFPEKSVDTFESIVLRNSGNDNQGTWLTYPRPPIDEFSNPASHGSYFVNCNFTMFRDAMMQSLMDETSLDTQGYRPTVLYVNGDYWGIYNIREKFTEHYLESTHDVSKDEVDLIESYGSANSGSSTVYNRMRDFINRRSMNDAANYQTVAEQYLEIDNFIDYHLAVIYGQNFDIGNIKCWRRRTGDDGRFRWMLYDQDYSFNLWKPEVYLPAMARDYSDYDNMFEFSTNPRGSGTGWPNSGGRTLLLREMLESDVFKERFVQRCADLLNTLLRSDRVVARIDRMADVIRPEMGSHLARWSWAGVQARGFGIPHKEEDEPLSVAHWERNVEVMREFARARPAKLRRDLLDHFGLAGGMATVTITTNEPDKGAVRVNTIDVSESPWSGVYFRAYPPTLTAVAKDGARFVGWSGAVESSEESIQLPLDGGAVSVVAVFE
ncbi:MAG: CotH kinase family protein, partial [Verrucomicrobiales bacterium]|nr:CotH kinase family protein [Verrucomicrobiales bacterium]